MLCEKSMKNPKVETLKGRFTHFENNSYLYFNNKDDNDLERHCIYSCLADLNNSYSKENNFYRNYLYLQEIDYKIGNVYAAIYPQDKMFYRVKIIQTLDFEKILVSFVDYGNTEIISKSELAPLPPHVANIKPLALLCKIPNIQLVIEKAFVKIIADICVHDMSITVERRTLLRTESEGGLLESTVLHLINFQYRGIPIRDYLIKNKIAVHADEVYEPYTLWNNDDGNALKPPLPAQTAAAAGPEKNSTATGASPRAEFTKTVIITSVSSSNEIYVHEFSKSIKIKLEALQGHIGRVVDKFKSRNSDNIFNKRNTYLTQFSEDLMWYRCKICNFDPATGFSVKYIDFGNMEHKSSLSELMLLTREMGPDAVFLMDEEPIAQFCLLSAEVISSFPASISAKRYLNKKFVEPVKKISITYHIVDDPSITWVINSISYHRQDLTELLEKQCVLKDSPSNGAKDGASDTSSHSLHHVADIKVADYLLNGCPDLQEQFFTILDYSRQYLVTHIAGLNQIWIDIGDGQTQEMCDNLLAGLNPQLTVSEVVVDYIYGVLDPRDDGTSVAVRCKILDVCDNYISIHLIDKGPIKNVRLDDIFNLTAEIVALPQQVLKFRFPDDLILKISEDCLLGSLKSLLEGQYVRLVRESLQSNVLVDVLFENKSILQTLISKNFLYLPDDKDWFKITSARNHVCVQANFNEIRSQKNLQSLYNI